MSFLLRRVLATLFAVGLSVPAFAQGVSTADSGDTAWVMGCALVMLVAGVPGLALHFAGRVGGASRMTTAASVFGIAAMVSLVWAMAGYSVAFSAGGSWLGGRGNLMLGNLGSLREGLAVPESAFVLLQSSFAIFAACLIAGAVAGRARFAWLVGFAALWSLVVYAPIAHWLWGGGWLAARGAADHAGSLVVQVSAGVSGLTAALLVGRRADEGAVPASASGFGGIGLIWVGGIAMAGAAALTATDDAAAAMINLNLSIAAGSLAWALIARLRGRASISGFGFGALAGLAAGVGVAGIAGPGGAILVGLAAGALCQIAAGIVDVLVDDPPRVFAVSGIGGAIGALLLPVVGAHALGGVGINAGGLLTQCIALGAVALWSVVGTLILGLGLSMIVPLRVSEAVEDDGLDSGWVLD